MYQIRRRWSAGMIVVLCLVLSLALPAEAGGLGLGQWPVAGQNPHNTRYAAAEERISAANVGRLAPRWVFTTGGDVSATPAVVAGRVYVPDWGGSLYAIDARSGRQIWARRIAEYDGVPGALSRTTPAVAGDRLVLGDHDGAHIFAVNRATGDLLWVTQVDPHPAAVITASPLIFDERVYVGVASREESLAANPSYHCCSFRGSVVALDLATGRILWKTYMAPPGYSGAAVWSSTPVLDERRQSLYVTTGNNYTVPDSVASCVAQSAPPAAGACLSPDDHFDSVLALDPATGAVKWATGVQQFDAWTVPCLFLPAGVTGCPSPEGPDFDFGSGPNLVTVQAADGPRQLLGAGQKSGIYWALDPDTGRVLWHTAVGPGSALGGIQWGSATDGRRIYVAISNAFHRPYTLSPTGQSIDYGAWSALDAASGRILWQTPDPGRSMAYGPVTAAGGVVFGASMDPDGHMYALDAATGRILWQFASGGSVAAGPAVVNGTVYWGSGYHFFGTSNNRLYAFSLDGK